MTSAAFIGAIAFLLSAGASYALTALVRRHAIRHALLDVPNARSAHTVPTPRGGGLSIAAVMVLGVAISALSHAIPLSTAIALLGGALIVSGIGWLDDRDFVPLSIRLGGQVLAAVWAVAWLGGLPVLRFGNSSIYLGLAGSILSVFAIVWLTNLYNFMDGIDGIAAGEAITAGGAATLLLYLAGLPQLGLLCALIVGACAGFLVWNRPPAKIFLGDVGSGLLGFFFATMAIASERAGGPPIVVWVMLFMIFVFDATVTLFRRAVARQKVYTGHRTHAYQRAVQSGYSHGKVSAIVALTNIPLAVLAYFSSTHAYLVPFLLSAGLVLTVFLYFVVERKTPFRPAR